MLQHLAAESDEAGPIPAFDTFDDPEPVPMELNLNAIMDITTSTMIRNTIFFIVLGFFVGSQHLSVQPHSALGVFFIVDTIFVFLLENHKHCDQYSTGNCL